MDPGNASAEAPDHWHRRVAAVPFRPVFGNGRGGGIYVWESRELAERLYTPEWKARITERYGAAPEIEFLDNPVTVDNVTGRVTVDAAKAA